MGRGSAPSPRRGRRARPDAPLDMCVMVILIVMMTVIVVMMPVIMSMIVMMPVLMMMDALMRAAAARVLVEQQRFDRHRHGIGRHADAPEVDIVEIAQHHAIDGQNLALDQELL